MITTNTQNQKIDWKKINTDNTEKLKEIKRLVKDWEGQLPFKLYQILMNVINK
jgi:hypothetical protein